jgi:alkaline phosphatase D
MHKLSFLWLLCWVGSAAVNGQKPLPEFPTRIAFGSCGHESTPQPVLDSAVAHRPDLFIFLGDNIYGDTRSMTDLQAKYDLWAAQSSFQNLKKNVKLLATWDDHDFGENDAGRHYPFKEASKDLFLRFFDEPQPSPRRQRAGIYTSYMFEKGGKKLQIILLDGRTFRDNLRTYRGEKSQEDRYFYPLEYFPHETPDSTLLGKAQWDWLRQELLKPADIRLIGSGTQFSIEYNGYEAWANFPYEQQKMLSLIRETRANGVIFLSGDVHYAEISKLTAPQQYPIYDVTASGITSTWYFATPNRNRIEGPVMENHFGLLSIDWQSTDPRIKMEIWDVRGNQRIEHTIRLSEITFGAAGSK